MKLFWVAFAILISFGVAADTITCKDGTVLIGKVLNVQGTTVEIKTDAVGTSKVALDKISSIRIDAPITVRKDADNPTEKGQLAFSNGKYSFSSGGETRTLEPGSFAGWHEGGRDPFLRRWSHEIAVDISGKTGNTERISAGATARSTLEGPSDRLKLYAKYFRARENHVDTDNEVIAGFDGEKDICARSSCYIRSEFEHDEFEGVDLRSTAALGYGYYFLKDGNHKLRGRVGLQYRNELYEDDTRKEVEGMEFGIHHFAKGWAGKLETDITYSPSFDDWDGDYRIHHETTWDVPLAVKHWKLRTGVTNDYNEDPLPGKRHLDTSYFVRFVYSF